MDQKFVPERVETLMQRILEDSLKDKTYDPHLCGTLTKELSETVLREVKTMGFLRYKFVCLVTVGQKRDQGIHMVSRFLWDSENDNYATVTYENTQFYAVCTLFAAYFE